MLLLGSHCASVYPRYWKISGFYRLGRKMYDAKQKYEFVKSVARLQREDKSKSEAEAVEELKGEKSEPTFEVYREWRDLVSSTEEKDPYSFSGISEFIGKIVSSGVFFMILGGALLYIAVGLHGQNHTSFTFIFVVLGVAILLYGTGTQGTGALDSDATAWKFKGTIAGGAGVLALLFGYFFIEKHPDIRRAFEPQRQYVKVITDIYERSEGRNRPVSSDSGYVLANRQGQGVPVALQAGRFVLYVPYFTHEKPCGFDIELTYVSSVGDASAELRDTFRLRRDSEVAGDDADNCPTIDGAAPDGIALVAVDTSGVDFDEYRADILYENREQEAVSVDVEASPDGGDTIDLKFN